MSNDKSTFYDGHIPILVGGVSWHLDPVISDDPTWMRAKATLEDGSVLSVHGHTVDGGCSGEWMMTRTTRDGVRMNYGQTEVMHTRKDMRELVRLAAESTSTEH